MGLRVDRRSFLATAGTFAVLKYFDTKAPILTSQASAASRSTEDKYRITEVITDSNQIDRNKYNAYYKVKPPGGGWFYIAQRKDVKLNNIFVCAFDNLEKRKGLLFPRARDLGKPVAVVSGEAAGIKGDIKLYDTGSGYRATFSVSPLITLPDHTDIDSRVLLNMHNAVQMLPDKLVEKLIERGIKVYTGKNIEDVYYHLYPYMKKHDEEHPNNPDKPWLEVKEDGTCIDHRNWSNTSAFYSDKMAVIPQTHYEYGTRKLEDRVNDSAWTRKTVAHELGHALADFNRDSYLDRNDISKYASAKIGNIEDFDETDAFKAAFEIDVARMDPDVKKELSYSWCKRKTLGGHVEAFANIFAAFTGIMSKDESKVMFMGFPNSSEYIRKKVLPLFDVNLSVDYVRENIYPDYIKDTSRLISLSDKKRFARELSAVLNESNHLNIPIVAESNHRHVECCGR